MSIEPNDLISFSNNASEAYRRYCKDGYFIEHQVFSDEECDALILEGNKLSDQTSYAPLMMPHRKSDLFKKALKNPKLKEILKTLVGGEPAGLQSEFFFGKPGTQGFSMHQDNFYVEAPFGKFASAWCALTDTYPEKGGLIVYPGSHLEGDLPVEKIIAQKDDGQDPNANNEQTVIPKNYRPLNAVVPRGAVLFIHGNVVHSSNDNNTNEFRHVLLNTYIKSGEPFRAGRTAKREEIKLDQ